MDVYSDNYYLQLEKFNSVKADSITFLLVNILGNIVGIFLQLFFPAFGLFTNNVTHIIIIGTVVSIIFSSNLMYIFLFCLEMYFAYHFKVTIYQLIIGILFTYIVSHITQKNEIYIKEKKFIKLVVFLKTIVLLIVLTCCKNIAGNAFRMDKDISYIIFLFLFIWIIIDESFDFLENDYDYDDEDEDEYIRSITNKFYITFMVSKNIILLYIFNLF